MRVAVMIVWCGVVAAAYTPAPPGGRPPCAAREGDTFCEQVEGYPTKVIQELLQSKSLTLEDFFTDESAGLDSPPDYDSASYRRKGRSTTTTQCAVPSRTARPRVAQDAKGSWRTVVQGEEVRQEVHVQICDESKECSRYCFQMYSQVPLVSIDANGDVTKNNFWMPSSCRCLIETQNDEENELDS